MLLILVSEPLQCSYAVARLFCIFLELSSVLMSIPREPVKLYGTKLVTCWKVVQGPANLSVEVIFDLVVGQPYG